MPGNSHKPQERVPNFQRNEGGGDSEQSGMYDGMFRRFFKKKPKSPSSNAGRHPFIPGVRVMDLSHLPSMHNSVGALSTWSFAACLGIGGHHRIVHVHTLILQLGW